MSQEVKKKTVNASVAVGYITLELMGTFPGLYVLEENPYFDADTGSVVVSLDFQNIRRESLTTCSFEVPHGGISEDELKDIVKKVVDEITKKRDALYDVERCLSSLVDDYIADEIVSAEGFARLLAIWSAEAKKKIVASNDEIEMLLQSFWGLRKIFDILHSRVVLMWENKEKSIY